MDAYESVLDMNEIGSALTEIFFFFFSVFRFVSLRDSDAYSNKFLSKGTREFWAGLSEPHNSYNWRVSDSLHQRKYMIYFENYLQQSGEYVLLWKGIANVFGWFSFVKKKVL